MSQSLELQIVFQAGRDIPDRAGIHKIRRADGHGLRHSARSLAHGELPSELVAGAATTIGVVATDATLTRPQANRIATMAHDGLARSISPVHTMFDGDTLFVLATGTANAAAAGAGNAVSVTVLGALAAEAVARAVLAAVRHASGWPGLPALRDLG